MKPCCRLMNPCCKLKNPCSMLMKPCCRLLNHCDMLMNHLGMVMNNWWMIPYFMVVTVFILGRIANSNHFYSWHIITILMHLVFTYYFTYNMYGIQCDMIILSSNSNHSILYTLKKLLINLYSYNWHFDNLRHMSLTPCVVFWPHSACLALHHLLMTKVGQLSVTGNSIVTCSNSIDNT